MQPHPRKALIGWLIALHAAIAACGPGLHAGPGLGHSGRAAAVARADGDSSATGLAANPAEHCPVCDYFAQGQLPAPPAASPGIRLGARFDPPHLPPLAPHRFPPSTRSRAPPRGILGPS